MLHKIIEKLEKGNSTKSQVDTLIVFLTLLKCLTLLFVDFLLIQTLLCLIIF